MFHLNLTESLRRKKCRSVKNQQWRNQGEANGQLSTSFRDLLIEIFIIKLVLIEVLLSQNCLFTFELHSQCIFFFHPNHK